MLPKHKPRRGERRLAEIQGETAKQQKPSRGKGIERGTAAAAEPATEAHRSPYIHRCCPAVIFSLCSNHSSVEVDPFFGEPSLEKFGPGGHATGVKCDSPAPLAVVLGLAA